VVAENRVGLFLKSKFFSPLVLWLLLTMALWSAGFYYSYKTIYEPRYCFKLSRLGVDNTLIVKLTAAEKRKFIAVWREARKEQCTDKISPMLDILEIGLRTGHVTEIVIQSAREDLPPELEWEIVWTKDWTRENIIQKIESNTRSIRLFRYQNGIIMFVMAPILIVIVGAMVLSLLRKLGAKIAGV
jgi:hypothetical protein